MEMKKVINYGDKVIIKLVPVEAGDFNGLENVRKLRQITGSYSKYSMHPLNETVKDMHHKNKETLAKTLGIEVERLNPAHENSYWDLIRLEVKGSPLTLDLTNPKDYCKYLIALSYKETFADGFEDVKNRPLCSYIITTEEDELNVIDKEADMQSTVYMKLGELDSQDKKLRSLLDMYFYESGEKRLVSNNNPIEQVKKRLRTLARTNPKALYAIIVDPYFEEKMFLIKAIRAGVVKSRNQAYFTKWDASIPFANNKEEALKALNLETGKQELINSIEEALNASK
jgi:hypothetical protein